ncbi:MAG TPA: DUF5325 family protein [Bacillota bacterium]|nr:DUF5325 family protein [Bacillota bacterium]
MAPINFRMLFLAIVIISMFGLAGVALAYRNVLLVVLFFILGNVLMGYGLYLKRRSDS